MSSTERQSPAEYLSSEVDFGEYKCFLQLKYLHDSNLSQVYVYWDFNTVLTKCEEFTQKQERHILNSTVHQILITGWKHAYRIDSQSDMMRL